MSYKSQNKGRLRVIGFSIIAGGFDVFLLRILVTGRIRFKSRN